MLETDEGTIPLGWKKASNVESDSNHQEQNLQWKNAQDQASKVKNPGSNVQQGWKRFSEKERVESTGIRLENRQQWKPASRLTQGRKALSEGERAWEQKQSNSSKAPKG